MNRFLLACSLLFFTSSAVYAHARPKTKNIAFNIPAQTQTYSAQIVTPKISFAKLCTIPIIVGCMLYIGQQTIIKDIQQHPYLTAAILYGCSQYILDTVQTLQQQYRRTYIITQLEAIIDILVIACGIKNELLGYKEVSTANLFTHLTKEISYSISDIEKILLKHKSILEQSQYLVVTLSDQEHSAISLNDASSISHFEVFQSCKENDTLKELIKRFYHDPVHKHMAVLDELSHMMKRSLDNLKKCKMLY